MPSGSTSEVFRSSGADSLAQVTVLTLLEQAAPAALPSGYDEGVYEGLRYGVTEGKCRDNCESWRWMAGPSS
jgi:hypothetical protein